MYHSYSNSYFLSIYYLISFVLLMLLNLKITYLTANCVMQVHWAQHVHYDTFYIFIQNVITINNQCTQQQNARQVKKLCVVLLQFGGYELVFMISEVIFLTQILCLLPLQLQMHFDGNEYHFISPTFRLTQRQNM